LNNVYNATTIVPNIGTIINGLTVPERSGYSLKGLIVACEADCFIQIRLNIDVICSAYVTGSVQTLFLDFSASPYGLGARDVISILAIQADSLTPSVSYFIASTILVEQL